MVAFKLRSSASASSVFCRTTLAARLPRTEEAVDVASFIRFFASSSSSSSSSSFVSRVSMVAPVVVVAPAVPLAKAPLFPTGNVCCCCCCFAVAFGCPFPSATLFVSASFTLKTFNFAFAGKFKCLNGASMSNFTYDTFFLASTFSNRNSSIIASDPDDDDDDDVVFLMPRLLA